MKIVIGGKKVVYPYRHLIMQLKLEEFRTAACDGSFRAKEITENDVEILRRGDFALANMLPYLRKQKRFATGFLFYEVGTDVPVGYIWVVRRGGNEMSYRIREIDAIISCVCVFREYRGRNIANRMLAEIVALLQKEGCSEVTLAVSADNQPAIRAYEKAGFSKVSEKHFLRILRKCFPYHKL